MAIPTVKLNMIEKNIVELVLSDSKTKNSLGYDLTKSFENHLKSFENDTTTSAIIIKSDSPDYFCSGGNLKERAQMSEAEVEKFTDRLRKINKNISELQIPTICLLSGTVMGGGLELGLSTDLRVLTKNCLLSLPQVKLGIIPGLGGIRRLANLVGISRAKEMILTGEKVDAQTALRIGLANAVEEDFEKANLKCLEFASEIGKNSRKAVREAKKIFIEISKNPQIETMEIDLYKNLIKNKERAAALKSFVTKKPKK